MQMTHFGACLMVDSVALGNDKRLGIIVNTESQADARPEQARPTRRLVREAIARVRAGGVRLLTIILIAQILIALIATPLTGWMFREALRANGMTGLDLAGVRWSAGIPMTVGLLLAIALVAFWLISMEFSAIVVSLAHPGASNRQLLVQLGQVSKRLLRPSSLPLLAYLFLLLPLTGFGFASLLTRGIAIPPFITGELAKEPATDALVSVVFVLLGALNVRLAATIPEFVLGNVSGARALARSWQMTRGIRTFFGIIVAAVVVLLLALLSSMVLFLAALLPTILTDLLAPALSPAVAAYSLGIAQVLGLLLTGLATALLAAMLITLRDRRVLAGTEDRSLMADPPPAAPRGRMRLAFAASLVALAALLGTLDLSTMQRLATQPETLVVGHRGDPNGGVENTVGALEAAKRSGANLVEMDVLQTKDEQFIVMHDANLQRLAGQDTDVKDLTLDELTQLTVRDLDGHEDTIPSLEEYMVRAKEIGMPILLEIKLGGLDTPDHVDQLVAELERIDTLTNNIYHSLDPASVARLKELRPDLTVGYTMAVAGGGVPDTPADFITVEQWSASEEFQQDVEESGRGFWVWTVNEDEAMREYFRRDVAGIITDEPGEAIAVRTEIDEDQGVADALSDALSRFVVWI